MYQNISQLNTKGIDSENVKNIFLLKSGAELPFEKTWWGNTESINIFINTGNSHDKPDKFDAVVKIELKN
jgi:hypothetical protein